MAERDIRADGLAGAVTIGYQVAARLGRWSLTLAASAPRAYVLEAEAVSVDPYWIAEEPLALALECGSDRWVWDGVAVEAGGGHLSATLHGIPAIEKRAV